MGLGDTSSVLSWLKEVEDSGVDTERLRLCEDHDFCDTKGKSILCTPRKSQLLEIHGEISPTVTSFSYISLSSPLFSPIAPKNPASLLPANRQVRYAETDASSLHEGENEPYLVGKSHPGLESLKTKPIRDCQPGSSKCFEPTIDNETDLDSLAHSILTTGFRTPNPTESELIQHVHVLEGEGFVWITSCLQCTVAGLPCSRTPPACSRCKRNGRGETCLLHRRRTRSELVNGESVLDTTPVLLKIEGEDRQVWEKKSKLMEDLLESWFQEKDRKNWVLPVNDGKIGHYAMCSFRASRTHPSEGSGRATYIKLRLADA